MDLKSVFRGCKQSLIDMHLEKIQPGDQVCWSQFTSTTTSLEVMKCYVGDVGPRTLMQIELSEPVARGIHEFSLYPSEKEVLLPPNSCFEFQGSFEAGHGLVMMHFKQIKTVDVLLDMSKQSPMAMPASAKPPVWEWRDGAAWKEFHPKDSELLEEHYQKGGTMGEFYTKDFTFNKNFGTLHVVNFERMTQLNTESNKVREIQRKHMNGYGSSYPAAAPGGTSTKFKKYVGVLPKGSDIWNGDMSIPQAKVKCEELPGCKGFTFEGTEDPSNLDKRFHMFFKSKCERVDKSQSSWTSFQYLV